MVMVWGPGSLTFEGPNVQKFLEIPLHERWIDEEGVVW